MDIICMEASPWGCLGESVGVWGSMWEYGVTMERHQKCKKRVLECIASSSMKMNAKGTSQPHSTAFNCIQASKNMSRVTR